MTACQSTDSHLLCPTHAITVLPISPPATASPEDPDASFSHPRATVASYTLYIEIVRGCRIPRECRMYVYTQFLAQRQNIRLHVCKHVFMYVAKIRA